MSASQVPLIEQNNGLTIPQIGLGLYGPDDETATASVVHALDLGYRLLDTAEQYENETGVGEGIRRSGIPREDLYVTTKLGNESHGYDATMAGFEGSLNRLGLDYLDLYLIHWPMTRLDKYVDSWRAFETLLAEGRVKSIGVANFQVPHLERLLSETSVVPVLNQIELHPGVQRTELSAYNAAHGILTEAWSPLAYGNLLANPVLEQIADRHHKSVAQVLIRWHIQLGNVIIPKTITPSRMAENLEVFDFSLDEDDRGRIATLEDGIRNAYDPDLMNV